MEELFGHNRDWVLVCQHLYHWWDAERTERGDPMSSVRDCYAGVDSGQVRCARAQDLATMESVVGCEAGKIPSTGISGGVVMRRVGAGCVKIIGTSGPCGVESLMQAAAGLRQHRTYDTDKGRELKQDPQLNGGVADKT